MFNLAIGWILFQLKNHSFHLDNKELCIQYGGLLRWLSDKESACNAGNPGLIPGSGRSPEGDPPVFLPGEFHGQRSLAGYTPWGHKELDMTEQLTLHYYYYLTRNARRVPQAETKRCLLVT